MKSIVRLCLVACSHRVGPVAKDCPRYFSIAWMGLPSSSSSSSADRRVVLSRRMRHDIDTKTHVYTQTQTSPALLGAEWIISRMIALLGIVLSATAFALSSDVDVLTLCKNIDDRLPCSVPDLWTEYTAGAAFGNFIGSATVEQTKSFYHSPAGCPVFERIHALSPTFSRFITEYMDAHATVFPDEYAEFTAMADAMDLPASSVFIQNACAELYLLFGDDVEVTEHPVMVNDPPIHAPYLEITPISSLTSSSGKGPLQGRRKAGHCSDIGLLYSSAEGKVQVIQGHNEDWWSSVADQMSIVHTPAWWGYLYPGQLPGTSLVMTSTGLSLTMNSLYPLIPGYSAQSEPNNTGVAYVFSFVLRSIVTAKDTPAVIDRLSQYPIYSGYSLNVMSACEGSNSSLGPSLTNIEGYGDRVSVQTRGRARPGALGSQGHFNAYINSAVEQDPEGTSSSRRECQLQTPFESGADVRAFLGDLSCPVFFTDLNGSGDSETMSTWIADGTARTVSMYRLPAECDPRASKCFENYGDSVSPKVYDWQHTCP